MIQLISRQQTVLNILETAAQGLAVSKILEKLVESGRGVARVTLIRDLNALRKNRLIVREGKGRSVIYILSPAYRLLLPIDVKNYFQKEADERRAQTQFNFDVFGLLKNTLNEAEIGQLSALNAEFQQHRNHLSPGSLKKEFERLTIELSWKSSRIEGNTYSLLETEALIQNHQEATGHTKEEADMILNHKKALDFIQKNTADFKKITPRHLREIHELLTANLKIKRGFRSSPAGIVGTRYRPLDNEHQIREAVEKMCETVNAEKNCFAKAILVSLLIAYIQPFEDGNKRTSRMTANAILMANDSCPLSYRSVDETEYKKAVILFYERNNLNYFKELFIGQFEFAVQNYFKS